MLRHRLKIGDLTSRSGSTNHGLHGSTSCCKSQYPK